MCNRYCEMGHSCSKERLTKMRKGGKEGRGNNKIIKKDKNGNKYL